MAKPKVQDVLRKIPQVNDLIADKEFSPFISLLGHDLVVSLTRKTIEKIREQVKKDPDEGLVSRDRIVGEIKRELIKSQRPGIGRVINATGIVLHTGLGRAVYAPAVLEAVNRELRGYCNLEVDRSTGERNEREVHLSKLICEVTGAEAATVVNNNAGATMIALATLASGREVVVSRSQLIEIGGSFRMPDVMQQSGARLVEVGTTNKTYTYDFERAITPNTALLMHVHTSNYRIKGFTRQVEVEELVELGRKHNLPVMDDVGSGALVDLGKWGLTEEPMVQRSIKAGADVICFSGDKLLGGPQAGILVGKKKTIQAIRKHPLFRALRPGKFELVALEATLRLFLNKDKVLETVPTLRMITMPAAEIDRRARQLFDQVRAVKGLEVEIVDDFSEAGGGSLPDDKLPTKCVAIRHPSLSLDDVAQRLRDNEPPIFTRVQRERVLFDVRTLQEGEADEIVAALKQL